MAIRTPEDVERFRQGIVVCEKHGPPISWTPSTKALLAGENEKLGKFAWDEAPEAERERVVHAWKASQAK